MARELTISLLVKDFKMDPDHLVITTRSDEQVHFDVNDIVAVEVKP